MHNKRHLTEKQFIEYLAEKHELTFTKVDEIIKMYFYNMVFLMYECRLDITNRFDFRINIPYFGSFYKKHTKHGKQ